MSIENPHDPLDEMTDGRDGSNKGPVNSVANALDGRDDSNKGPLDRAAKQISGGTDGVAAATSGQSGSTHADSGSTTGGKATAVFDSKEEAQRAVEQLRSAGVNDSSLSLIAQLGRTTTIIAGEGEIVGEEHVNFWRGVLGGGALGAGIAIAALAIPGVPPMFAVGAIALTAIPTAATIGAGVGASAGVLNEVFSSHGVNEEDSAYYGHHVKQGGTFVSVDTSQSVIDAARAQEILYSCGGHSASSPRAM